MGPRTKDALLRLRRMVAALPADERDDLLYLLGVAERFLSPLPEIRYVSYPNLQERRRRALAPRPGDYLGKRCDLRITPFGGAR